MSERDRSIDLPLALFVALVLAFGFWSTGFLPSREPHAINDRCEVVDCPDAVPDQECLPWILCTRP